MTRCFHISIALVAAGAFVLGGCAKGARPGKTRQARAAHVGKPDAQMESHARYADGVIAEMKGDLPAAINAFAEAVSKSPGDEELALDVTKRFLQYRQPVRALEILTNAVARPHVSGELDARLGLVYAQLGQTELAIKANQAAVQKNPRLLSAHQALYVNLLQAKQEDAALKVLDAAAAIPHADADYLIGVAELYSNFGILAAAQRTNVQARALSLLERAASAHPTNTQSRLKLADGFSLLGESAKAIGMYRQTLDELEPSPLVRNAVRSKLAELYLRRGERKPAAEQLEAILREDPMNAQACFILGNLANDDQRPDRAADYFNRTVVLNPKFEQAYYELASAQLAAGRADDALATLENARTRFQQTFFVEYLSGVAYSRRKDYPQALRHYTAAEVVAKATQPNRLTHGFYFQLGIACERSGDFDTAVKHFEKCLELSPNFADAQNYLGYMWAEHGTNLDRARELIEQAVKAEPDNGAFLDSLGWVLFKLGKPRDALEPMLRALQKTEPPDATLYDHLGDIHAALGELDKAREAWRKSVEIEPNEVVRKKLDSAAPK